MEIQSPDPFPPLLLSLPLTERETDAVGKHGVDVISVLDSARFSVANAPKVYVISNYI